MTTRGSKIEHNRILGLFTELLGVGGVQEAGRLTAAAIARIAARHGWSAEFLSLNDDAGEQCFEADAGNISLCGFARSKLQYVCAAIASGRKNSRILVAAHPNLAFPAQCARLFSPRLRVIVISHGVDVWKPLPMLTRRALLRADCLLVASRDTAQKLADVQGATPAKIRRLPWPLNPSFLRMADSPKELSLPRSFPQGQVILTVGRWNSSERYKGADDLIRSVAQLRTDFPSLHMVAVGAGDDLSRLQELTANLNVSDRVHFFQGLSRAEIAACYSRADIFALPSTGEGFGIVYLEAMAFSKPVVGTACGGTTDLIEDGMNGLLVPPRDNVALVAGLRRLLSNQALQNTLGRRGADMVRQKYRFGVFEADLEHLLHECGLVSQLGR